MATSSTKIGRVSVNPQGEYLSGTAYQRLDIVTYNGSGYICIQDCQNKPVTNTSYWYMLVQKGDTYEVTEEDLQRIARQIEEDASSLFNQLVAQKTSEFNANATQKTQDFNANATQKTNDFDSNATSKTQTFDNNASNKTDDFNTNATQKGISFDSNYDDKMGLFNGNATTKTNAYNDNATSKTTAYNNNATSKTTTFNDNATDKTTEFNTNAQEKTEDFDEHVASYSARLETVEEVSEDSAERIALLESNFDTNTPTPSDNITINDGINARVKYTPIGKTSQNSYDGRNQLDANNPSGGSSATVQYDNDIVTITSASTTVGYSTWEFSSIENDVIKLNGIILDSNGRIARQLYDGQNWGNYSATGYTDGSSTSSLTITVPAGITKVRFLMYSSNQETQAITSSRYKNVIVTKNNSDMSYEPYVGNQPSPSPDHPQAINNVSGNVINYSVDGSANNNLLIEDALLTLIYSIGAYKYTKINYLPKNQSLYCRAELKQGKSGISGLYVAITNNGANPNSGTVNKFVISNGSVTTESSISFENSDNIYFSFYPTTVNIADILDNYSFEISLSPNQEYTHHKGKSVTFPLANGQKLMQGDYLASDGVHHVRKQIVLDGTETVTYTSTYSLFQITKTGLGGKKQSSSISTHFNNIKVGNQPHLIWVFDISDEFNNDADSFKTWLAQQYANNTPVIVEIVLAEEVIEPYTSEQQIAWNNLQKLESYKNVTHIYTSSDGLAPDSKVTYLVDPLVSINSRLDLLEE